MVHKIEIFNKNPAMSKMIPSTIMVASLSVSRMLCAIRLVARLCDSGNS